MEEAQKPHEQAPAAHMKKNFFQKNALVIGIVVFLIVAVGGGVFAFLSSRAASNAEEEQVVDTSVVETVDPETLGLSMTAKPDKKAVRFKIANAGDIKSVEYQVVYEADSTAQEKAEGGDDRVQRGITGEASINGKASYESEWLDLGSCSRNVCKYDKGVEELDLTLKIIKKNGKTYESQLNYPLN